MKPRHVVPLFAIAHLSHHLSTGVLAPLLPLLRQDLELNYFQAGVLVSSLGLSYGFGQVPMALLADRFSERALIVIGLIGTALAGAAVGLTSTYWQMVPCLIALGLLGATYHAPVSALLSQLVPPERRGQSLGTHTIGGSASFLITPVVAAGIASWAGAWRWSFVLLGIPALVMGVVVWFATGEHGEVGGRAVERWRVPSAGNPNPGKPADAAVGVMTWKEIVGAIGMLALLSLSLAGPLLLAALRAPAGIWLPLSLGAYGVSVSARMPAIESLIADVVRPEKRATALGVYYLMGQETAGVITPLVGRLIDVHGPNAVFLGLPVGLTIVALVALAFRKRI